MKHDAYGVRPFSRPFFWPLLACVCAALITTASLADEADPAAVLRAYSAAQADETQKEPGDPAPMTSADASEKAPDVTGSLAPAAPATAARSTEAARQKIMPLIEKTAQAHALPPDLLDAVVRVESRYNPHVRNAGAIGLMQIKLATARGMGFQGDAASLARPDINLHWGAKYLARAYALSGGDTCLTLARYQGGHRVAKLGPAGKAYCAKVRMVLAQND